MTPSRNLGECATDPWDATGESDLQKPELAGNQDVGRAAVSETSPTRHCQEGGNNKEQHCDNSLGNGKWLPDYLPVCSLAELGSAATRIPALQGGSGNGKSGDDFEEKQTDHWGPRE